MSGELAVSLALKLKDQGSGPATQALQKITRAMKETGDAAKTASSTAISAFQKLANARETVGIRSEKAIQNEIRQTEAAYQRLAASGQVSARELGRAQDAMRGKVAELRKELNGLNATASGTGSALRTATSLVGAGVAAKMVVQGPISKTMDFGRELAHASNVMFAGQSLNDRRAGMKSIFGVIKETVKHGGTPEEALAAYQTLAGSGEYKSADVAGALPQIMRAANANNGTADEFSRIALAARRNLGLTDFSRVANMATTAGQLGGFEIKDMAKGLPEQLAAAKNAGLTGYSGYAALLALNQASVSTAGTTDQASNNVVNLLNKVNSRDTANDFKKLGIDLDGSLLKAQEKGTNTLEAFGNLVDHVVSKDKRYAALKEKAKTATGDEQKKIYSDMAQIAEGAGIGKVLQDRQALMGFLAYRNQHDKYGQNGENTKAIYNTGDSVGDNQALITESPAFQAERLAAEKALAMQEALDKVNPLLGGMAEGISQLIRDYPELSAAVQGGKLAIEGLSAAALTAAGALTLLGGGKGGIGNTVLETAKKVLPGAGAWRAGGFALAPLAAMWGVSEWAGDPNDTLGSSASDKSRTDALRGTSNTLTKFLGYLGFNKEAEWEAIRKKNQGEVEQPVPQLVRVEVDVKNGNIVAAVNEANARDARRH